MQLVFANSRSAEWNSVDSIFNWFPAVYAEDGITPYLQLFTSQYQNSPKLMSMAESLIAMADSAVNVSTSIAIDFELNNAVGDQIDILGDILGVSRILPFQPTDPNDSATLTDALYKILLRATIALNHWDGKIASIYPLWRELFPDGEVIIKDELDMSFTVTLAGSFSSLIVDMITHDLIIPRPEGVMINFVFGELPFFGFDLDDDYISGFDKGKWA